MVEGEWNAKHRRTDSGVLSLSVRPSFEGREREKGEGTGTEAEREKARGKRESGVLFCYSSCSLTFHADAVVNVMKAENDVVLQKPGGLHVAATGLVTSSSCHALKLK